MIGPNKNAFERVLEELVWESFKDRRNHTTRPWDYYTVLRTDEEFKAAQRGYYFIMEYGCFRWKK